MTQQYKYSIVAPVCNEEEVIKEFYKRLVSIMDSLHEGYEIIFINDGSTDKSLQIMKELHSKDERVKIINFSRNFGHQIAITAGMDYSSGEAVIIIDADLQDPPEVIPRFIEKWKEGFEVVYGIRESREGESAFKKLTAKIFYRILQKMIDIKIPLDAGDFRLIDRKVVDSLKEIRERSRFVRGLTSWVGFKQEGILYKREKRFAGHTKYSLKKMLKLAVDAVFSFSNFPLRIASYFGFLIAGLSFLYLIYVIILKLFTNTLIPGWTSLIVAVLFLGGVQLICLGIIGEYIGRIGEEVKHRPLYIIKEVIGENK
jgi:dolichol-phosphate mannosyltransferase